MRIDPLRAPLAGTGYKGFSGATTPRLPPPAAPRPSRKVLIAGAAIAVGAGAYLGLTGARDLQKSDRAAMAAVSTPLPIEMAAVQPPSAPVAIGGKLEVLPEGAVAAARPPPTALSEARPRFMASSTLRAPAPPRIEPADEERWIAPRAPEEPEPRRYISEDEMLDEEPGA